MSARLTVQQVCERALRAVGAFPITESAARPEHVEEARYWLDLVLGHMSAKQRRYWLVPTTAYFDLTAGTATYDLLDAMGTDAPDDGVMFPITCTIRTGSSTDDSEVAIVRRNDYESIGDKEASGTPRLIYIDRLQPRPQLYTWPVLATGSEATLGLGFQTFTKDVTGAQALTRTHGAPSPLQLWMVKSLTHQLYDVWPPETEARRQATYKEANALLSELDAFFETEHNTSPGGVAYYDGISEPGVGVGSLAPYRRMSSGTRDWW